MFKIKNNLKIKIQDWIDANRDGKDIKLSIRIPFRKIKNFFRRNKE